MHRTELMHHGKKKCSHVTVRSAWISENGFAGLFKGAFATSTGNAMIEATDHTFQIIRSLKFSFTRLAERPLD